MPKKNHLSFEDLGLTTAPPALLTKTREQLKQEEVQRKKEAKQRLQKVVEEVSLSCDKVNTHKEFMQREAEKAKRDKLARKHDLHIKHLNARRERDAKDEESKQEAIKATNEYIKTQLHATLEENKRQEQMKELITKQNYELLREQETSRKLQQSVHVAIHRTEEIEQVRSSLPILREEQPIMEAINHTSRTCVLVCGETGSGKTTQVPQFLWEAGYGHAAGASLGRDGMILITEPRRVAAIAMAKRVAEELNVEFGQEVCYQVRYDSNLHDGCKVKFATEGIVLKEIQSDFLLKSYSVVVIDEAHERSVSCDLLIGLLSRITPLRNEMFEEELRRCNGDVLRTNIKPLRLVIMSATMRVSDFRENAKLFPVTPPLISAEARRFPVSTHFARKTELKSYVNAAFEKVKQIHKRLPPGGILVFLCTQREIEQLCQKLKSYYARTRVEYYDDAYHKRDMLCKGKAMENVHEELSDDDTVITANKKKRKILNKKNCKSNIENNEDNASDGHQTGNAEANESKDEFGLADSDYDLEEENIVNSSSHTESTTEEAMEDMYRVHQTHSHKRHREISIHDETHKNQNYSCNHANKDGQSDNISKQEKEEEEEYNSESEVNGEFNTLHILPLYALLDSQLQQRVFMPPPPHKRMCVVATNVAETSITIPHIRYVVDAGRVKTRVLDHATQASCFHIEWVSQASAEQRSGRAGRTGPGHCYRLYSTAVFANCMAKHSIPELLRTPLDSVVLLMKFINIKRVAGFPFPSPPRDEELVFALSHLDQIGALNHTEHYAITTLGKQLMPFPLLPRFARAIVEVLECTNSFRLVQYVLAAVALISITSTLFTSEGNDLKSRKPHRDESAHDTARRAAMKEIINHGSDLVTYANALIMYTVESTPQLCRRCCLVEKSMKEAKMLYAQLRSLAQMYNNNSKNNCNKENVNIMSENDVIDSLEEADEMTINVENVDDNDNNHTATHSLINTKEVNGNNNKEQKNDTPRVLESIQNEQEESEEHSEERSNRLISKVAHKSWMQALQPHLNREEEMIFRQVFIPGFIDHVARRATVQECRSFNVEYHINKTSKTPFLIVSSRSIAYIHPTSTVARISPPPEFVTFAFLQKVKRGHNVSMSKDNENGGGEGAKEQPRKEAQTCMLGVTVVLEQWLHKYNFVEEEQTSITATSPPLQAQPDEGV